MNAYVSYLYLTCLHTGPIAYMTCCTTALCSLWTVSQPMHTRPIVSEGCTIYVEILTLMLGYDPANMQG